MMQGEFTETHPTARRKVRRAHVPTRLAAVLLSCLLPVLVWSLAPSAAALEEAGAAQETETEPSEGAGAETETEPSEESEEEEEEGLTAENDPGLLPETDPGLVPEEGEEEGEAPTEETEPSAPALPPLTLEEIRKQTFTDLGEGSSWSDSVRYTAARGILSGSGGLFRPEGLVTRAALVTALFRMSGEAEAPAYTGGYQDAAPGDWYAGSLAWALQAGLLEGLWSGTFSPSAPVTRTELAVLLTRHQAYLAAKTGEGDELPAIEEGQLLVEDRGEYVLVEAAAPDFSRYKDGASVPDAWAAHVVRALDTGLFKGMVSDTIYPRLPVNRGQLAQALVVLTALETEDPLAVELAGRLQAKRVTSVIDHAAMQAKVNEVAAKYGAVGLQVAVLEEGVVTDSFAYGWATKNSARMTADHKLRVASLSKVVVGLAAMILREQGVIDLDTSIGTYWGFPTKNPRYPDTPVSIRALLSHTSSLPLLDASAGQSRSAVSAKLRANQYSGGKPGSVWSWGYNNYGFAVLGMTLELAAHDYLDNVLQNRLFYVMDIDAAFEGGEIQAKEKLATIYRHGGGVGRSVQTQRNYKRPIAPGASGSAFAGGLTISANDLAKLLGLLANDGTYQGLRLLSRESVALMETRFDQILSDGTYQALPLRSQDNIYGRSRLYYHTGSAYGVYNFMSYDPATGDGIVVLSSGASAAKDAKGIYAVCGTLAKYFYGLTA